MSASHTPMPTKKRRLPVMFDDDLWEYLEQRAALEQRSLSNMVAAIVREAFNRDTGKKLELKSKEGSDDDGI